MFLPHDLDHWLAEGLRFTLFSSKIVSPVDAEQWWTIFSNGGQLTDITRRPKNSEVVIRGYLDKLILELKIAENRIDWLLLPDVEDESSSVTLREEGFLPVGNYGVVKENFIKAFERWYLSTQASLDELVRIAYGTVLLQKQPNPTSTYKLLGEILPFVHLQDGWKDFHMQVNVPSFFKHDGGLDLVVNAIGKYTSIRSVITSISDSMHDDNEHFLCRIELDKNTDVENKDSLNSYTLPIMKLLTRN